MKDAYVCVAVVWRALIRKEQDTALLACDTGVRTVGEVNTHGDVHLMCGQVAYHAICRKCGTTGHHINLGGMMIDVASQNVGLLVLGSNQGGDLAWHSGP